MLVQTLVAELPIEAFDVRVLHGFAWLDERQLYAGLVGPGSDLPQKVAITHKLPHVVRLPALTTQ